MEKTIERNGLRGLDAALVKAKMESAGVTLMMMHVPGCWPAGYKSCVPEVVRDFADMIGVKPDTKPPMIRPSSRQVSELEDVMSWVVDLAQHCKDRNMTYVARTIVYALPRRVSTGKRINSWRGIAEKFDRVSHHTVQSWYEQGISIIVRQQNEKK